MYYIVIGVCAIFVAILFDVFALRRIPRAKQSIGIVTFALFVYAIVMACFESEKLGLPTWLTWVGWPLLVVSLPLLLYSLFVNLPFRKTYIEAGVGNKLVRNRTYALVRHPGVIWLAFVLISLVLVSQSKILLIATPVWLAMDVLHVVIQDKFFFGKMFSDYEEYRRETPILIPNMKSIGAFLRTLKQPGTQGEAQ